MFAGVSGFAEVHAGACTASADMMFTQNISPQGGSFIEAAAVTKRSQPRCLLGGVMQGSDSIM